MGLIDQMRAGEYTASNDEPVVVPGRTVSLAAATALVASGTDVVAVVRDFLDQAARRTPAELEALVGERPATTGSDRGDALVAAVAEHLAATRGFSCPGWAQEPGRFLDRFWFVSTVPGLRAISLAQAPVAFKRRGILWPARSLERV